MNPLTHDRPRNSVRLELASLEERDVPSVSVNVVGSHLQITGDSAGNNVVIYDDGHGNVTATVTTGDSVVTGGGKNLHGVIVNAGGGDDSVDYRLTRNVLVAEDLDVDLGAGNDRVRLDLYRGVSGVPLDIDIDAGAGRDSADIRFGVINNASVRVKAALGAEADNMTLVMFNGLSGKSRMAMDVAGGGGADRVDINMMGKIDAASSLDLHAGNVAGADDRLVIRYRGELDGTMKIGIDQSAMRYGVQARFALDAASDGKLSAAVTDGRRSYRSSVVLTDHTSGEKVSIVDRLGHLLTEPMGTKLMVG